MLIVEELLPALLLLVFPLTCRVILIVHIFHLPMERVGGAAMYFLHYERNT